MIRRTVEISRQPAHLAVRDEQLLILHRDAVPPRLPAKPPNLAGSIPIEDLGVIVVDERDTTYSHAALVKLAEYNCALVVCGRDHLPCGMYLPLSTNTELLNRLDAQMTASKPRIKRTWQSIIVAKVRAQARNLDHDPTTQLGLRMLADRVRSGDPDNIEAIAAQRYWPAVFADVRCIRKPFRRRPGDQSALAPNNLLDYGYAVMRAAVARSLIASGLLPALGIKHRRRDNPFCLADDLVEPLRPLVDRRVRELASQARLTLDQPTKAELLRLLTASIRVGDSVGPAYVAISRYVASFVRVLTGESDRLETPLAWLDDAPERGSTSNAELDESCT